MILSQTAVYALKAVLHLADTQDEDPVRVDDIAAALAVPRNYLSKILHLLAREGVLESTRGPHGGFTFARSPEETKLADVIEHFDDLMGGSACLLGKKECSDATPCAAHTRWKEASMAVRAFFRDTSVADLSRPGAIPM